MLSNKLRLNLFGFYTQSNDNLKKQRRISAFILATFLASVALGELYPWLITTGDDIVITFQKSCKRKSFVNENTSAEVFFVQNNSDTSADNAVASVSCAPILNQLQPPSGIALNSIRIDFAEKTIIGECPHLDLLEKPPRA